MDGEEECSEEYDVELVGLLGLHQDLGRAEGPRGSDAVSLAGLQVYDAPTTDSGDYSNSDDIYPAVRLAAETMRAVEENLAGGAHAPGVANALAAAAAGGGDAVELPAKCELCGAAFASAKLMMRHFRRMHDRSKLVRCPQAGCNAAFEKPGYVVEHFRAVHRNEKPFRCTQCDYRCGRKSDLLKHVGGVHDGVRPYACTMCKNATFTQSSNLNRHIRLKHSR